MLWLSQEQAGKLLGQLQNLISHQRSYIAELENEIASKKIRLDVLSLELSLANASQNAGLNNPLFDAKPPSPLPPASTQNEQQDSRQSRHSTRRQRTGSRDSASAGDDVGRNRAGKDRCIPADAVEHSSRYALSINGYKGNSDNIAGGERGDGDEEVRISRARLERWLRSRTKRSSSRHSRQTHGRRAHGSEARALLSAPTPAAAGSLAKGGAAAERQRQRQQQPQQQQQQKAEEEARKSTHPETQKTKRAGAPSKSMHDSTGSRSKQSLRGSGERQGEGTVPPSAAATPATSTSAHPRTAAAHAKRHSTASSSRLAPRPNPNSLPRKKQQSGNLRQAVLSNSVRKGLEAVRPKQAGQQGYAGPSLAKYERWRQASDAAHTHRMQTMQSFNKTLLQTELV